MKSLVKIEANLMLYVVTRVNKSPINMKITDFIKNLWQLIPLFHTGYESPESPRIDFFLIGGDS